MTDWQTQLITLNKNLNTLREREAKYGGNAPLELLNQIDDHLRAIELVQEAMAGRLTPAKLEAELAPLNLALNRGSSIVTGDITGSVVAMGKGAQVIINQAQSAVDEARRQDAYEQMALAQAVARIASDMQELISPFAKPAGPADEDNLAFTIAMQSSLITRGRLAGSPYKALLDYKISDAPLFYGRRAAIQELFHYLQPGTLTVLHAESGAGKTSLLQAGLSSRLLVHGHLPLHIRPWNQDPAIAIKRAFLPNLTKTPGLAQAPLLDFLHQVTAILGQNAHLYLFLDQFEEFFTLLDSTRQNNFVAELGDCLDDPTLPVCWMLALRDEYFGQIATFSPRIRNPFENQYLLKPLTYDEARQVIVEPAARAKITYEPGLPDRILQDLTAGHTAVSPPELQLVCSALFDALPKGETVITTAIYTSLGAASGILGGHLNQVLQQNLGPEDRQVAQTILQALVTSDNRRTLRTLPELVAGTQIDEGTLRRVLQLMVDHRLVRLSDDKSAQTGGAYELAHDYLLDQIQVDPEIQARKAVQELLAREVQSYKRHGTRLDRQKLRIIESHQEHLVLDEDARELLRLSRAAKNRVRLLRIGLGVAIFVVLLFIVVSTGEFDARAGSAAVIIFLILAATAVWAVRQRNQARRAGRIAQARSLSAEALNRLDADAELSLLLALEAVNQARIVQSEDTLRQVLLQTRPWHLLDSQSDGVLAAAWTPDGARVALGLRNGDIQLWQTATHTLQTVLAGHTEAIRCLQFSPCGRYLASASALTQPLDIFSADDGAYGAVRIWNLEGGGQLHAILEGHSRGIFGLSWSPNSARLATASADGSVRLWQVDTMQQTATLTGHSGKVRAVAWNPDGTRLASAGDGGEVFVWNPDRQSIEKRLSGHQGEVFGVAWRPDGCRLATAGKDGTIRLWDSSTGHVVDVLAGHKSFVRGVSWHPNGRYLASSASGNNKIIIWDAAASQPAITLTGHTDWIRCVAWDAAGERLISASDDGAARIWQVNVVPGVTVLAGHTDEPNQVVWHPNGTLLASAGKDATLRLWQLEPGPTGQPEQGRPVAVFTGHTAWIWSVAWNPDGTQLLTASGDGTARLWNLPQAQTAAPVTVPECARLLDGQKTVIFDAVWHPNGQVVATAGGNKTIHLWDAQTGALRQTLAGHQADVLALDFSPDGSQLVSASADHTLILWDLARGRPAQTFKGHTNFVWDVAFSPNGRQLASASGDATVRLWNLDREEPAAVFRHEQPVASVAWSHSGNQLASTSDDGVVRLWQLPAGRLVGTITGHNGGVWSVAWSGDDTRLATAAADGLVRVFYTRFDEILALAKSYKRRELTAEERHQFLGEPVFGADSGK